MKVGGFSDTGVILIGDVNTTDHCLNLPVMSGFRVGCGIKIPKLFTGPSTSGG